MSRTPVSRTHQVYAALMLGLIAALLIRVGPSWGLIVPVLALFTVLADGSGGSSNSEPMSPPEPEAAHDDE